MTREQEIRARVEQATPGPWGVRFDHDETGYPCYFIHGVSGDAKRNVQQLAANARFIEGAREDITYLLAELQRLRDENERLMARLGTWDDCAAQAASVDRANARLEAAEAALAQVTKERDDYQQIAQEYDAQLVKARR